MSKKMSKINQSRKKLKILKEMIASGQLGKIKPRTFPFALKLASSAVLLGIFTSYALIACHFFE